MSRRRWIILLLAAAAPAARLEAQSVGRPRIALGVGSGVERGGCPACTHTGVNVLSASAEAGVAIGARLWAGAQGIAWTQPDLIEGPDHSTAYLGAVAGYRLAGPLALRAGLGWHHEAWSESGMSSAGLAYEVGLEAVLGGSRGFAFRVLAEAVPSVTGPRRSTGDGAEVRATCRPALRHAGIGLVWR